MSSSERARGKGAAFWALISIGTAMILTVISMAVTGVFSRKGPHIAVELVQRKVLTDVDELIAPDVSVYYKDEEISNLLLLSIRIRNSGTRGIVGKSDVVEPITFAFAEPQVRILGKPTVSDNPEEITVSQDLSDNGRELKVEFDLLNRGWFFVLDVLYSGSVTSLPNLSGKIRDIHHKELTTLKDLTKLTEEQTVAGGRLRVAVLLTEMGLIGLIGALFFYLVRPVMRSGHLLLARLSGFLSGFYALFGLSVVFYGYWELTRLVGDEGMKSFFWYVVAMALSVGFTAAFVLPMLRKSQQQL